jgi:hypothetical protein
MKILETDLHRIYEDFSDVDDPRGRWIRAEAYELVYRALELCNESRDRLTRFSRPVEGWIEEARFEKDTQ